MKSVGLIIQIIFLAIAIYVYLFSRGFVKFGSDEVRERSEAFRKENQIWMRYLSLALGAIMLANILLELDVL